MYSMRLTMGIIIIIIITMATTATHINITTMVSIRTINLSNINRTCINNNSQERPSCRLVCPARMQVWHQPRLLLSLKVLTLAIMVNNPVGSIAASNKRTPGSRIGKGFVEMFSG
jgi:hypothetical protein